LTAPPNEPFVRFAIDPATAAAAVDAAPDPIATEPRLDPTRATAERERPSVASRQRGRPFGPFISLAIHLSPLLLLLNWSWNVAPAEATAPIPVQLVLEEPPPPPQPPPAPKPEKEPPRGRLASKDMGSPEAKPEPKPDPPPAEAAETPTEPQPKAPPVETQMAAVTPPPKPTPPPDLVSALPAPTPPPEPPIVPPEPEPSVAIPEPKPAPPAKPPQPKRQTKQTTAAWPLPLRQRTARYPGPEASRDEYLAYCESLIGRYHNMLSPSLLAGRSGVVTILIVVLGDGTISRVAIMRDSGYRDIDVRAQQMVVAVGRFPPLPQRFQQPALEMGYTLPFRNGILAN
jgi:TonB family protein